MKPKPKIRTRVRVRSFRRTQNGKMTRVKSYKRFQNVNVKDSDFEKYANRNFSNPEFGKTLVRQNYYAREDPTGDYFINREALNVRALQVMDLMDFTVKNIVLSPVPGESISERKYIYDVRLPNGASTYMVMSVDGDSAYLEQYDEMNKTVVVNPGKYYEYGEKRNTSKDELLVRKLSDKGLFRIEISLDPTKEKKFMEKKYKLFKEAGKDWMILPMAGNYTWGIKQYAFHNNVDL